MEEILLEFNSARIKFLKWYFAAIILLLAWAVMFFNLTGTGAINALDSYLFILPLASIVALAITEIRVRSRKYIMTNTRIVERNGILSKEETFLAYDRVANYTVKQNFIERLLGIGNIEVESIDGDEAAEITMEEVGNIGNIKGILDKMVSATRYGSRGR